MVNKTLANRQYDNKEFSKALLSYQSCIKEAITKSEMASLYYNMGVCNIKLRNFAHAIICFHKSLTYETTSKSLFNCGYSYAMVDDTFKAIHYFKAAQAIDPSDTDCQKAINIIKKKLMEV